MKQKTILLWGIFFIVLSIVLGAFGAHALKKLVSVESINSFETGVKYQMYQGLGLLIIGSLFNHLNINTKWPVRILIIGTLLFSFSIYLLSLQSLLGISLKFLGPVTPLGGTFLIIGWVVLAIKIWKNEL